MSSLVAYKSQHQCMLLACPAQYSPISWLLLTLNRAGAMDKQSVLNNSSSDSHFADSGGKQRQIWPDLQIRKG